tara:strand:- start:2378 stop:2932 length:555 start_codon:yes stop_codon:yes gene_type:complete
MAKTNIDIKNITKENLKILIDKKSIENRVVSIANQINKIYVKKNPIILCVLNGAFIFYADLVRHLNIDFEVDFIKLSSYGSSMESSGTIRMIKDVSANIAGRDVIIVEDIIDTGLTINYLRKRMIDGQSKSVSFVTCLLKDRKKYHFDFKIDCIGFKIPDKFVIGYGLDLDQRFRGLKNIYTIK